MYRSGVETLNHHHLFHFWTVVREGGVTRASEKLNVSQPTVSGQLRELQEALGEKLLVRSGRTVVLTDVGRTVYRYADEIFALGRELQEAVKGRVTHPARLAVGLTMVVPKLVAYQMLEPALQLPEPIQLDCVQERLERLVAELAIYSLDVVLADTPAPPAVKVRAYSHLLGDCACRSSEPRAWPPATVAGSRASLDGAPFLLPSGDSGLRLSLEDWFRQTTSGPGSSAPSRTARSSTPSGGRERGCSPCPRRSRTRCGVSTASDSWDGSTRSGSVSTRSPWRESSATRRSSPSPSAPGPCSPEAAPSRFAGPHPSDWLMCRPSTID